MTGGVFFRDLERDIKFLTYEFELLLREHPEAEELLEEKRREISTLMAALKALRLKKEDETKEARQWM